MRKLEANRQGQSERIQRAVRKLISPADSSQEVVRKICQRAQKQGYLSFERPRSARELEKV